MKRRPTKKHAETKIYENGTSQEIGLQCFAATDYEKLPCSNMWTLYVQTSDKNTVCGHILIKNSSTLPGNIPFALRIGLHLILFQRYLILAQGMS